MDSRYTVSCNTLIKTKSDHYPILITLKLDNVAFKSQFKFHKMCTLHTDCDNIVRDSWKAKVYGCHMYILDQKLKILKGKLKVWNKHVFGNVLTKSVQVCNILKDIQKDIATLGYTDSRQELEVKAQHDLDLALRIEEEFWKEKSKLNWHLQGDRNTKFFHTFAKIKRKNNLISSLNVNGQLEYEQHKLESHIESHFFKLFNSNFVRNKTNLVHKVIPKLVNDEINAMLTRIPSPDEIFHAITNLNINSAHGLDGFGTHFYVHFWHIIKTNVINAVTPFFLQGWILPNFNASNVVLIPTIQGANSLDNFMPIAMTNFKYKIISKILADRLSYILPSLISPEQKGFIAGRIIRDGICLTSEVINILGNKSYCGNVALKIEIAKAFDTLNWDFIIQTLACFGFSNTFCNWIQVILSSSILSICLNGKVVGFFKCTNGVRQSDPLSPLLFCLAEEALSRGLTDLVSNNKLNLIQAKRICLVPSHTLFADDIMVFYRGDSKSLNVVYEILNEYAYNSVQLCNIDKSLIFAGGIFLDRHKSLANIIGFKISTPPLIYLGVPIFVGKPKALNFLSLAGKIRLKLASWKAKLLTMTGRVLLVKSVIQSKMVHTISIYDCLASTIKNIESWIRNFIWSGSCGSKKACYCILEEMLPEN